MREARKFIWNAVGSCEECGGEWFVEKEGGSCAVEFALCD